MVVRIQSNICAYKDIFLKEIFREVSFLLWSNNIRMEENIMTDTALRAGAQSANITHMVFANEEHEKFYYEKLEQARYQETLSQSPKVIKDCHS